MQAPSPSTFSSILSLGWRWHGRCSQVGSGLDMEQRAGKGREESAGIPYSEGTRIQKVQLSVVGGCWPPG